MDDGEQLETIPVKAYSDKELKEFLKSRGLALTVEEAKLVAKKLGRDPTLTELWVFNIEWSEHTSYKSSRDTLKMLPTQAKNVILGPSEDSGIVELGNINGEKWGVVISHESHNHPSQVVPYEGAATGIGGDIRDVLCMGAKVVALSDPLRFGNPHGPNKNKVRYIANSVIDGIAEYGNAVGIPNIGGDVYFNDSFDENCLVNVVCLGIVKAKEIVHSYAPKNSAGHDIVIVGKATDFSGFGGASFASLVLDEKEEDSNKGAVQVPDPFLKNVLIRATYAVFDEVRKQKLDVGFKDMGAGGIMCSTSELGSSAGYGVEIDLDNVHVSISDMPPYVIACGETQERFTWVVPPEFTPTLLKIYNEDFELGNVAEGAKATVIGKIIREQDFILKHRGKLVCRAPIKEVTTGIKYSRDLKEPKTSFREPSIKEPKSFTKVLLKILSHPNVCSREKIFKHYDTSVQGNTVIAPGRADAGVIAPDEVAPYGIALSTDCNPAISRISPYWGAANAVAEAMRNVAAVGAVPAALTDCLNYSNPEVPEGFWQFVEGVKGISDAARFISRYNAGNDPVPVISGNVSFYNQSSKGKAVDPSAIISCIGILDDYSKAITMDAKKSGSMLYLLGERKNQMGGSVYYSLFNEVGTNVPTLDFGREKNMIHSVVSLIGKRLVLSCHDISDGGLAVALSEMAMLGNKGMEIDLAFSELGIEQVLFGENSGFVLEIDKGQARAVEKLLESEDVPFWRIGTTKNEAKLTVRRKKMKLIDVKLEEMDTAWRSGLPLALD
ncbi:MAG: phosphoribosylformylglycinamidine synthase [archaeon GW2011_AR3]|nr:MAG: phosphoribosylformylglycinamidine synthase [archaeon GW2011_AR3]